ncbi:MAG: DUF4255 domain-containing protein [Verrucomicrobiales bacterium]|nr:DUF4255 domain-containing protein [Verrucomicrobiales bacterium]
MVSEITSILKEDLERFLRRKAHLPPTDKVVSLTRITERDGVSSIDANTVGMCLFNLDEERIMRTPGLASVRTGDRVVATQPEVRLNLYILFAANFADYQTALRFLGWTIGFFQTKRVFAPRNTPAMDAAWSELAVDLYAMTLEQQNYLWSILGAKYLPSVAYQVRPVVIQEADIEAEGAPVTELQLNPRDVTLRIPARP